MSADVTTAWPLSIRVGDVGDRLVRTLAPDADERAAIARGLDLVTLGDFTASVRLSPWRAGVKVEATWSAKVERVCSLTLETFPTDLHGAFEVRLSPDAAEDPEIMDEIVVDPDGEDPPDRLEEGRVPLGALLVEHLALELEPFPRAPGARFEPPPAPPEPSPFEALARLGRLPE